MPAEAIATTAGRFDAWADRMLSLRQSRAYAVVAIVLFGVVYAFGLATRHGLVDGFGHVIGGDLLTFRTASDIVSAGDGARLYDFALQAAHQQAALAPERVEGVNPFTSPPFVALAYRPWARLSHPVAFALWTVVSVTCLPIALLLIGRWVPRTRAHWRDAVLLGLSFTPVLEGLAAGSNALVSLPIFAAAFVAFRSGRDAVAGVLLGLQLFRPQLLLAPLLLLAWKRRWRALAGFVAVALVLATVAVWCVHPRSVLDWLGLMPLLSRMIFEPGMPTPLFSSIHALFLLPLGPRHLTLGLFAGTVAALVLIAVLLNLWSGAWRAQHEDFALRFAALLVVTPLVSQYLQLHDLAILILPAVLLVEEAVRRPDEVRAPVVRLVLALVWLLCMLAPAVTSRVAPVPLAPVATLVLGWLVAVTLRRGAATGVRAD